MNDTKLERTIFLYLKTNFTKIIRTQQINNFHPNLIVFSLAINSFGRLQTVWLKTKFTMLYIQHIWIVDVFNWYADYRLQTTDRIFVLSHIFAEEWKLPYYLAFADNCLLKLDCLLANVLKAISIYLCSIHISWIFVMENSCLLQRSILKRLFYVNLSRVQFQWIMFVCWLCQTIAVGFDIAHEIYNIVRICHLKRI